MAAVLLIGLLPRQIRDLHYQDFAPIQRTKQILLYTNLSIITISVIPLVWLTLYSVFDNNLRVLADISLISNGFLMMIIAILFQSLYRSNKRSGEKK